MQQHFLKQKTLKLIQISIDKRLDKLQHSIQWNTKTLLQKKKKNYSTYVNINDSIQILKIEVCSIQYNFFHISFKNR